MNGRDCFRGLYLAGVMNLHAQISGCYQMGDRGYLEDTERSVCLLYHVIPGRYSIMSSTCHRYIREMNAIGRMLLAVHPQLGTYNMSQKAPSTLELTSGELKISLQTCTLKSDMPFPQEWLLGAISDVLVWIHIWTYVQVHWNLNCLCPI